MKEKIFSCQLDLFTESGIAPLFLALTLEERLNFVNSVVNEALDNEYPEDKFDVETKSLEPEAEASTE